MQKSLKWFAFITTIGMLLVLIGGALVTKTDSGLGCGRSWPLCEGKIIPSDMTIKLLIELSHRLISGVVGLMVLILAIWSWKTIDHIRETKTLALTSIIFLLLQGLIGAAAVMWGQSSVILALHFGISLISFAAVFLLTLLIFEVDKKFDASKLVIHMKMKIHIFGVTIYSYLVVYSGALVRHKKASLVCPEWPFCSNTRLIPTQLYEWVHMGHRTAAALIFIWILIATVHAIKYYKNQRVIYSSWIIALTLVTLQVSSGAFIVLTNLNLYIALLHALIISCLFGVLSYLVLLATRSIDLKNDEKAT